MKTSKIKRNSNRLKKYLLERITYQIREFPGYATIRRVALIPEPWTVENKMLTPTLKLRRTKIMECYQVEIDNFYKGHWAIGLLYLLSPIKYEPEHKDKHDSLITDLVAGNAYMGPKKFHFTQLNQVE